MRIGAHMSVAGGVSRAVDRAVAHGCEALQIFSKNANQWKGRPLDPAEVRAFRRRIDAAGIRPAVAHASYLINLATTFPLLREQSIADALPVLGQACAVALVIVLAAWLLIRTSSSEAEQRVFTAALLLLLGGAADYLSLSALFSGLICGVFLQLIGGPVRDSVGRDVLHFQRPLLVLVLIVSGARLELQAAWLGSLSSASCGRYPPFVATKTSSRRAVPFSKAAARARPIARSLFCPR